MKDVLANDGINELEDRNGSFINMASAIIFGFELSNLNNSSQPNDGLNWSPWPFINMH